MPEPGGALAVGARFEAVARRSANRIAFDGEGCSLSFAALESTTRGIAARIERAAGPRAGGVALLVARKGPCLQAMLAALRCGRAYVPLDTVDPDERLRFILRDCVPAALLAERGTADRARALAADACPVIEIDGDETPEPGFVPPEVDPGALACILYTSGSTGTPKGVTRTQRALMFFADAYARRLGLDENDRLSHLWATSFAASNLHFYGALLTGATLCIHDVRREGLGGLRAWLDRERVSVVHTFPTVFRSLCAGLAPGERLAHLRALDVGAEAVYATDFALFERHTRRDAILAIQLGATEADVIAQHLMRHGDRVPAGALLPLGTPPEGLFVGIRRDDGSDAPVDEVGAVVVSGAAVCQGYLRRPDLDAQSLPPDPKRPGLRCYVSGDRGWIDAAGSLHFTGREGSRVKIRGHSVDLAEVDAALAATPGVARAAALAPPGAGSLEADRIVAYVSATPDACVDAAGLRASLAARLPPYMLPATFVFMDALPETTTGKVDRQALLRIAPAEPAPGPASPAVPPSLLESTILAQLREVLRAPAAGMDDDFFALGGDSIRAAELFLRLAQDTGKSLAAATIVEAPTARALARAFECASPRPVVAVKLRDGPGPASLWCVPGLMGDPLWFRPLLASMDARLRIEGLSLVGLSGMSIGDAAAHCADTIVAHQPEGPCLIVGYSVGGLIAVETARELVRRGRAVAFTGVIDTVPPGLRGGYLDYEVPFWKLTPRHMRARVRIRVSARARQLIRRVLGRRAPRAADRGPAMLAPWRGRLQPGVRGLVRAYNRHELAPVDAEITVFRAIDPPAIPDPELGWRGYARRGVRVFDIPGNHLSLMEAGRSRVLAARLAEALAASMPARGATEDRSIVRYGGAAPGEASLARSNRR